ncbi:MAG: PilT/PilU family type 4a pilus ATPase [Candidatus Gracilibacteria bacterium]|nr:PilT/PilU family type 4a pilus ATPase [Candidatus Gracilibacteria bacterium]
MNSKELLKTLLQYCSEKKYPDIHLNSGFFPKVRNENGHIDDLKTITIQDKEYSFDSLDKSIIGEIITEIVGEHGFHKFLDEMELDTSYALTSGDRYRVNCYIDSAGYSVAFRLIPSQIPTMEELGLGDQIKAMCDKTKGLILVTGPTGSGKSTNLAAMINYINKNHRKHIITIEDPIEFAFHSDKSLINQREIGNHTKSFSHAMRSALREDPDVIVIGEMRDPETIKAAITLAETGHLVLSTLHTNDSVQTIDRIVDVFPGTQQKQIRMQLAMSLVGILSQRLVARSDKEGRIPTREILVTTDAVKNLIITAKTHQLYSVLEVGKKYGMILMDKYLMLLYQKGMINKENLLAYARDKDGIEMMLN